MKAILLCGLAFVVALTSTLAAFSEPKPGERIDLVLSDGRVLRNVEVIKVEAGSVLIWARKTLTAVKVGEIRESRPAEVDHSALPSAPSRTTAANESQPSTVNVPAQSTAAQQAEAAAPTSVEPPKKSTSSRSEGFSVWPFTIILAIVVVSLAVTLRRVMIGRASVRARLGEHEERYRPVIDLDAALRDRALDLEKTNCEVDERRAELSQLNLEVAKLRKALRLYEAEGDFVACDRPQVFEPPRVLVRDVVLG